MERGEYVYSRLMETPADQLQDDILSEVRRLQGSGLTGIYVSINKPYETMNNVFMRNRINTNKIFFIDCITSQTREELENVLFIPDISDLGGLSIAIARFIDKIPDGKFLLIDAVHTLWIYHTPNLIARFIQNLTERSYRDDVAMTAFIVESEDKRLMRRLIPFFDQFMESGG